MTGTSTGAGLGAETRVTARAPIVAKSTWRRLVPASGAEKL